jgi:hypothetical protein
VKAYGGSAGDDDGVFGKRTKRQKRERSMSCESEEGMGENVSPYSAAYTIFR